MTDNKEDDLPWDKIHKHNNNVLRQSAYDRGHEIKGSVYWIEHASGSFVNGRFIPEDEARELWENQEKLRIQLAACGVISSCNTKKSQKEQRIDSDNPYYSASYQDVLNCVNREIKLLEENARLRKALEEIEPLTNDIINKHRQGLPGGSEAKEILDILKGDK